jgi:hypothetical protein
MLITIVMTDAARTVIGSNAVQLHPVGHKDVHKGVHCLAERKPSVEIE